MFEGLIDATNRPPCAQTVYPLQPFVLKPLPDIPELDKYEEIIVISSTVSGSWPEEYPIMLK